MRNKKVRYLMYKRLANVILRLKILLIILISIYTLLSNVTGANSKGILPIYADQAKFVLNATSLGLTASGEMNVLGKTVRNGKELILVRSKVNEISGFVGFIIKLLRIYKESNTFDTYLDPKTLLPVFYEVYKVDKNDYKQINESVEFDRQMGVVRSFDQEDEFVLRAKPNTVDAFSGFLQLIARFTNEELCVGKRITISLYAYRTISDLHVDVINHRTMGFYDIYDMEIKKLPIVFKYPASIRFEVKRHNNGLALPTRGNCTIMVPHFMDVVINGQLSFFMPER